MIPSKFLKTNAGIFSYAKGKLSLKECRNNRYRNHRLFFKIHDQRLIVELTHKHMDIQMNTHDTHNTRLLDETNTATVLGGSVVTSQVTLRSSDVTTMAPPFSPHSAGNFLRSNFFLPVDADLW